MLENLHDIFVRLHRPSTLAPWGFRLQGGAGTSAPLSIQRVFAGGAADGQLMRGDILVAVDGKDVFEAPHFVAEDVIKKAGRELLLTIKRVPSVHTETRNEIHAEYPFQMHSNSTMEDYEHARNLTEIKQKFSEPPEDVGERGRVQINARPGSTSYLPKRPNLFKKAGNAPEFGWVPKTRDVPDYQSRYRPHHVQQVLSNEEKYYTLPRENIRHEQYERPAWLGTLRSSGGAKPWEVQDGITSTGARHEEPQTHSHFEAPVSSSTFHVEEATRAVHQPKLQVTKFSNKGFSSYEQRPVNNAPGNAKVAHLQYNTPLSLYSKENAEEAFRSQVKGFGGNEPAYAHDVTVATLRCSGHGSQPSFDSVHSDVYRMVREEDKKRRGHNHPQGYGRGSAQRSARLEHLIHENDEQQMLHGEMQRPHVYREKMGISEF